MGTWGAGSFDNDDGSDFAIEFEQEGMEALELAFDIVDEEYLEGPAAQRAVAAAEILALSKSGIGEDVAVTPELFEAIERHASAIRPRMQTLRKLALAALDRVEAEQSELKQLWEEGDASEWQAAVDGLRERLVG
jgi:Domain of unknown function (DUF4259)